MGGHQCSYLLLRLIVPRHDFVEPLLVLRPLGVGREREVGDPADLRGVHKQDLVLRGDDRVRDEADVGPELPSGLLEAPPGATEVLEGGADGVALHRPEGEVVDEVVREAVEGVVDGHLENVGVHRDCSKGGGGGVRGGSFRISLD